MAGDKTYIEDDFGKKHRATRTKAVTPESIVWSNNPNDYTVQVRVSGKWHRAILTYAVEDATFFDNINIDKALVTGGDGKTHTALIVSPEASNVVMSPIPTDEHSIIEGTTTGETVVNTYSENWSNVVWQDNVNVYKVLVEGSDGKKHTALLTTEGTGGGAIEVIVRGVSPLSLPDAIANSLEYLKAFGGTEQRNLPDGYIERQFIYMMGGSYLLTDIVPTYDCKIEMDFQTTSTISQAATYLSSGAALRFAHVSAKSFRVNAWGNTYDSTTPVADDTRYKFTYDNLVATLKTGDTTIFTNTFTDTGTTTAQLIINGLLSGGDISQNVEGIYLYSFKVWNAQDELVANYIPAVQKGTVPVVGFYDTVTDTFKTATSGTFAAGGEAVPTPDTPMDIISNNGVLKVRNLRRVPSGYKEVEYLESTGEEYIDLGYALDTSTDDIEIDVQVLQTETQTNFFGARYSTTRYVYTLATNGVYWRWGWKNNSDSTAVAADTNKHTLKIDHTTNTLLLDGVSIATKGSAVTNIETPTSATLFCIHTAGTQTFYFGAVRISGFRKWTNGTLMTSLVPCRRKSDNVLGMYDLVTDTFFTNAAETGAFIAGADMPDYEIYTDGTVETINVHGNNLFNKDLVPNENKYINKNTGNESTPTSGEFRHSDYIEIKGNTQYYVGITKTRSTSAGLAFYDDTKTYISGLSLADIDDRNNVVTSPANAKYVRFCFRVDEGYDTNWETSVYFCVNGTMSSFEPYYDGGTATAKMLLKVGDNQDEQEILSGAITRNVGVLVLDGTEGWTLSSVANTYLVDGALPDNDFSANAPACICSRFIGVMPNKTATEQGDDSIKVGYSNAELRHHTIFIKSSNFANVSELTSWLADQYNAGTPVIVVYPLATPTTESVAGQALQVQQGDNVVEITQASLDNLELEAKYQAAVSLTIQEVQDANLDPNVQVTIN